MHFKSVKWLVVFTIFISLLFMGCGGSGKKVVTLKIAHGLNEQHPVHKGMAFMAQKIFELSDSTMVMKIFPNEQLGNEKECIEQLQIGSLDMTKVSSSALESFVPEMGVYAMPFLFRDEAHKWAVFNGPIGRELLDSGESSGLKGLVYYDAGARSFYTTKAPILKPEDLQGLKIRTQQSPMAIKMIQALGGSATPISWGELYTSLQQGVVDGAENNAPSLYTANHYEIAKHYSLDEHTAVPDVVLISTITWNKLTPEQQQIVQKAAELSVDYQRKVWKEFVDSCLKEMEEKGLKVYHPEKGPFIEKGKELWKEFDGTKIGDLTSRILEVQ